MIEITHYKEGPTVHIDHFLVNNRSSLTQFDKAAYALGIYTPNYPVPAIPTKVGFMPAHHTQPYPSAYWYVCSTDLLWSFFNLYGMMVEEA